jgi:exodeoxyribonuclease VII small subunit
MSDKPKATYDEPMDEIPSAVAGSEDVEAQPDLSFEESLRELDDIVGILEAGNIPLEQSLGLLQRGMALAAQCDSTLTRAEATLEQLVATDDGELVVQRVAWDDEDADDEDENDDGDEEDK